MGTVAGLEDQNFAGSTDSPDGVASAWLKLLRGPFSVAKSPLHPPHNPGEVNCCYVNGQQPMTIVDDDVVELSISENMYPSTSRCSRLAKL